MLFKRYASPFLLIDELINTNQLSQFIDTFINKVNEDDLYEFYLHKVFDMTFEEFRQSIKGKETQETFKNDEEIKTTINKSMNILGEFKPMEV